MKITGADVLITSPGRNFVTLRVHTDEGIYGLGDATLNGRELAVAAYLRDHVVPCLVGRDAERIEDTWQYLYRGAYWRRGPVTMAAISAVDTALWDIKGKALGRPVYDLLGGASREGVLVYGHASGRNMSEAVDEVGRYIGMGYRAIRAQAAIEGLAGTYGVGKGKDNYEPAERGGLPKETVFSVRPYMDQVPRLFERIRAEHGWEAELLHDVHHRLTPIEAGRLGRDLEEFRLFWLEDAVACDNQEGFRLVRQHTTTPLAVGEVFNTVWDAKLLIEEQLIDYLRMPVCHGGGITHLRKVAAVADMGFVRTGFHGATDLSPVAMAAALHFDLWVPNFGIQEWMRHSEETEAVFPHAWKFADGYLHPGDAPGLGVDYDEALAAKYEYDPAYLPVARLTDGTMYNW